MKRFATVSSAFMAAMAFALVGAVPVQAATGEVVVFETEFTPLVTYQDPAPGCYRLPPAAHVLSNRTDAPVTVYGDPFCLTPGLVVQPGFGSHVAPGSGSFSVA